ncbi:hypothetical protein R2F25_34960 [Streptomyces sp. UP1A-1]|nr:hypothetical protein [Streptomyces sp. UP1A-1]
MRTTAVSPSWAYFGLHTRLWELGAGGLLALCAAAPARLPRAVAAAGSWLGLSAILASAVVYDADTPFPGHAAGLPVLGALLVIAGGCSAVSVRCFTAARAASRDLGGRRLVRLVPVALAAAGARPRRAEPHGHTPPVPPSERGGAAARPGRRCAWWRIRCAFARRCGTGPGRRWGSASV